MNLIWRNSPWLRILIPYGIGLIFFDDVIYLVALLLFGTTFYLIVKKKPSILNTSLLFLVVWLIAGGIVSVLSTPQIFNATLSGTLHPIERIQNKNVWICEIVFLQNGKRSETNTFTHIDHDTIYEEYHFSGKLIEIQTPLSPIEKDPKPFWNARGILESLKCDTLIPIHKKIIIQDSWIEPWFKALDPYLPPEDMATVKALLIGDTQEIDHTLKASYRNLGISHLLAVSGMHVGLLFLLLKPILQILFFRRLPRVQIIVIILLLWSYCVICGNAASIVRACYMFSVLQLGQLFRRKTNPINLISFSAFSLLIWDPKCYLDWGFILSHLAVLGLSIFQETNALFLSSLRKTTRIIVNGILSSIQAQWITAPFLLFHTLQFPTYFLIANIILIPLSTCVLYLSLIGIFIIPIFPLKPYLIVWQGSIHFMNKIVQFMDLFPNSLYYVHHFCWMEIIIVFAIGMIIHQVLSKKIMAAVMTLIIISNIELLHLNLRELLHEREFHLFQYHQERFIIETNGHFQNQYPVSLPATKFTLEKGLFQDPG